MTDTDVNLETESFVSDKKITGELLNGNKTENEALRIKVYRRRWLILLIFILFTLGNKCQYLQYTMVLNVITRYYQVSTLAVKCTAMVYNLSVPLAIYPCTLLVERWGLRPTLILASASTCLGTWTKYLATSPDGYALTLLGQTLVGAWQVLVISMPGGLAARWFGPTEVATATAVGYVGIKLGMAVVSLLMPVLVRAHEDVKETGDDLRALLLPLAVYCTAVALLVSIFFDEEPKLPPSKSRALQKLNKKNGEFWAALLRLMRNKNYFLLWNAQNMIIGQVLAVTSSLNAFYLLHFQNGEKDVGRIGLVIILSGLTGAVIFSKILDKTKAFKTIAVCLYAGCILSFAALAISFCLEIRWAVYVAAGIYGLFCFGYHPISCEVSVELTYPETESFTISVLLLGNQFFTTILLTISDKLLLLYDDTAVYIFFFMFMLIGFILTLLTEDVRKRQTVGNNSNSSLSKPNKV